MNSSEPVIVIGAGLAGLRCAQVLRENGFRVVVLEKSDYVGGRLRSYSVDGYRIDEGFQLVNPSYPELRATGVLQHLDLRPFPAAIDLLNNAHWSRLADPRQEPLAAFWALRHLGISQSQKIARLLLRSRLRSARSIAQESDVATREGLRQAGLSQEAIDNVFQPFLRGTLLEDNLDSSWNYVQILLKSFARGRPSTHPNGIVAVADAVAQGTTVQLGTEVTAISATSVTTSDTILNASAVVVATDGDQTSRLLGTTSPTWRRQFCWWWSLPANSDATLKIDLVDRLLASALNLSAVAPERSPKNRSLIAAPSLVGTSSDTNRARASVARLYNIMTSEVELVTTTEVNHALPSLLPQGTTARVHKRNGIYMAGDFLTSPSIQGALVSGRRAATWIVADASKSPN